MDVVSPKPPWESRKTLERENGVLGVVAGVFLVIVGLVILGVFVVYPPAGSGDGYVSFVFVIVDFTLWLDGQRRLNEIKDYQNNYVLYILLRSELALTHSKKSIKL